MSKCSKCGGDMTERQVSYCARFGLPSLCRPCQIATGAHLYEGIWGHSHATPDNVPSSLPECSPAIKASLMALRIYKEYESDAGCILVGSHGEWTALRRDGVCAVFRHTDGTEKRFNLERVEEWITERGYTVRNKRLTGSMVGWFVNAVRRGDLPKNLL